MKEAFPAGGPAGVQSENETGSGKYPLWRSAITNSAFFLPLWLILYPHPHKLLVLANLAIPLTAMAMGWKSKNFLQADAEDTLSAAIYVSFFMPSLALFMDAERYCYFPLSRIFIPAAVLSVCLTVIFINHTEGLIKSGRSTMYILLAAIALGLSYTVSLNCAFDNSAPETFRAKVENKSISRGRYFTSYYLYLDRSYAWMADNEVQVPEEIYDRTNAKDEICLNRRKGLFNIPWFKADFCEEPLSRH